jgi:quinol-cytochrome oxidoreductase complex cytochrome b subunit
MLKLTWMFGLILLFFIFLLLNHKLNNKIDESKSILEPTKKDKIKLILYLSLDKLLGFVLLLYFMVVILSIIGLMALLTIALFN